MHDRTPPDEQHFETVDGLGADLAQAFRRAERSQNVSGAVRSGGFRRRRAALAVAALLIAVSIPAYSLTRGDARLAALSTDEALAVVADATLATADAGPRQLTYSRFTVREYTPYPGMFAASMPRAMRKKMFPGEPFAAFTDRTTETWISLKSTGFVIDHQGAGSYPTEQDRIRGERYVEAKRREFARKGRSFHSDQGAGTGSSVISDGAFNPMRSDTYGFDPQNRYYIGGRGFTLEQVRKYPTEPEAIVERLRKSTPRYVGAVDEVLWASLSSQYIPGYGVPLPAKLRAGFVKALALVPNVESLGERTAADGRVGLVFRHESRGARQELVFDRETGTLLSSTDTVVRTDSSLARTYGKLPLGTVIRSFALIDQRITDRLPMFARKKLRENRRPRR